MSDKVPTVPTAKVYVFKDPQMGDRGFDWKVCLMTWGELMVVVHDAKTFEDAWAWLYENYHRDND